MNLTCGGGGTGSVYVQCAWSIRGIYHVVAGDEGDEDEKDEGEKTEKREERGMNGLHGGWLGR
jgi:hypothetical protein